MVVVTHKANPKPFNGMPSSSQQISLSSLSLQQEQGIKEKNRHKQEPDTQSEREREKESKKMVGMEKCRDRGEIKEVELAETTAEAPPLEKAELKKNGIGEGGEEANVSSRRRRRVSEQSSGSAASSGDLGEISCSATTESCCSSDETRQLLKKSRVYPDPHQGDGEDNEGVEIEASTPCRQRKEATASLTELRKESEAMEESTARPTAEQFSPQPHSPTAEMRRLVTWDSIEWFLADAEKTMKETQKQMSEKYNFDFEKEVPLQGRFEWIPVKKGED